MNLAESPLVGALVDLVIEYGVTLLIMILSHWCSGERFTHPISGTPVGKNIIGHYSGGLYLIP